MSGKSWLAVAAVSMATSASLSTLSVGPAAAAVPVAATCGAVLANDAYLPADLTCLGDGVTLSGDGALDLRGHRLIGTGGTAVTVKSPHAGQVKNGRIQGWTVGVTSPHSPDQDEAVQRLVAISSVRFVKNQTAVDVSAIPFAQSTSFFITKSRFDNNTNAVSGLFTGSVTISFSLFRGNRSAVRVDSGAVDVRRSQFVSNDSAVSCEESSCVLGGNRLQDNPRGVSVRTFGATLTGNVITGSDVAFDSFVATGTQLSRNTFLRNKTGVNLSVSGGAVTNNVFRLNGVGYTASGGDVSVFTALLERNSFVANGDGIFVEDEGTSLRANKAIYNKRWGIFAPKAVDLGGNQATGNGRSPQCQGVVC